MDDAVQPGAVQRDHGGRGHAVGAEQVFSPPKVALALLAHGGREHHGPLGFPSRLRRGPRQREQAHQSAGVVRDTGTDQSKPVALHREVHVCAEHGIQVGRDHDGATGGPAPACHGVAHPIQAHLLESQGAQLPGHEFGAAPFRPGGRGDLGDGSLEVERLVIGGEQDLAPASQGGMVDDA